MRANTVRPYNTLCGRKKPCVDKYNHKPTGEINDIQRDKKKQGNKSIYKRKK